MANPEQHKYWPEFVAECYTHGISLENEEDWIDWWKMFLAGVNAEKGDIWGGPISLENPS